MKVRRLLRGDVLVKGSVKVHRGYEAFLCPRESLRTSDNISTPRQATTRMRAYSIVWTSRISCLGLPADGAIYPSYDVPIRFWHVILSRYLDVSSLMTATWRINNRKTSKFKLIYPPLGSVGRDHQLHKSKPYSVTVHQGNQQIESISISLLMPSNVMHHLVMALGRLVRCPLSILYRNERMCSRKGTCRRLLARQCAVNYLPNSA